MGVGVWPHVRHRVEDVALEIRFLVPVATQSLSRLCSYSIVRFSTKSMSIHVVYKTNRVRVRK